MNFPKKKHLNHQIDDYSTPKDDKSEPHLFRPIIYNDQINGDTKFRSNYAGHNRLSQRNESEVCKIVSSRKNKNRVLRMSQNVRFNQRVCYGSENNEEPRSEHVVQQSNGNEHPRVPDSSVSELDENSNNLQGLKGCYKDIVILNSEYDTTAANDFRQKLLNLDIPEVTVDIFEDINPGTSEMRSLSLLHEQYRTVLLFITNSFAKDYLRRHQAEVLLRESLETDALGRWVVPVWIDRYAQKLVLEWTPIKGVKWYSQESKGILLQQLTDLVNDARARKH